MAHEVGDRVMVLLSAKDGVVNLMGMGKYLGNKVPEKCGVPQIDLMADMGISNPTVKLDNGVTVYGMECWWGSETAIRKKFDGWAFEEVPVERYRPTAQSTGDGDEEGIQSL